MGRTRFYLGLVQPLQGVTFAFLPRPYPDRRRLAAFVAGGIAANASCTAASLGLALYLPTGRLAALFLIFAAANALLAIGSLIPVRLRVGGAMLRSDGRLLLQLLRTGSWEQPPPDVIQTARGCRRLWRAVGDRMMDRLYTLSAALSWIELGSTEKAESLYNEAVAIDAAHPYIDWLEAVARTSLALARGEVSEARAALSRAEVLGDATGAEGRCLVALLRASLLEGEGRPGESLAAFEALSADPAARRRPELGLSALTGRLRAACAGGDPSALPELRARYETERRRRPSDVRDLHTYRALARCASSRGADARDDYRRALTAMASLAAMWRDAQDRTAFADAQRDLIEEARQSLGAEGVAPFLETPQADQAAPAVNEAWRRWSSRLMLINLVSVALLAPLAMAIRPHGPLVLFLAVLLVLFTFLGGVCLLFDFTVGKLLPSMKRLTDVILLSLAVMPWLGGLFFGIVSMISP
jgi:tetratricopeptide (TPR) repeat protein